MVTALKCGCLGFVLLGLMAAPLTGQNRGQTPEELRRSAAAGDTSAMLTLAEAYQFGRSGLPQLPDSARYYLLQAAAASSVEGMYLIALDLLQGLNGPIDDAAAISYLQQASATGHRASTRLLMELYQGPNRVFSAPSVQPSPQKAAHYAALAAKQGQLAGYLHLHEAHLTGIGAAKDTSLAVDWLQRAADSLQAPAAQLRLADWYMTRGYPAGMAFSGAWDYYDRVVTHSSASLEERTAAEIGRHAVRRVYLRTLNLNSQLAWPDPVFAPQWRIRP